MPYGASADTVLVRALYLFSLLSANIYFSWLAVLPVVNAVTAELFAHDRDRVDTTTISETFGAFNVAATVLIIAPMSVIFVLRVHRTLCLPALAERTRRALFLVLLVVQYSMFVVLRYDMIKGTVHYAFTGLTFALLYAYHFATSFHAVLGNALFQCKVLLGGISSVCIFCFLGFILVWQVEEVRGVAWTVTCLCEIAGAVTLAALYIVDIYSLLTRYDPWRRTHPPVLEYLRPLACCLYYSMAAALVLFGGWVLWVPLLAILDPLATHRGLSLPTTVSQTFQDFGTLSTIYLVGPLSAMFLARMYRIAFATHLAPRARRALLCGLVVAQVSLFVVIRFDAIRGTLHYVAACVVFACAFVYHACISRGAVARRKYPLAAASFACLVFFGAVFFALPAHDSWWWGAACCGEIAGILLLLVLDVVDIMEDCRGSAPPRAPTRAKDDTPPPGPRAHTPPRGTVLGFPDRELLRRAEHYRQAAPVLLQARCHDDTRCAPPPPAPSTPRSTRSPELEHLFAARPRRPSPHPRRSVWEEAPHRHVPFWDDSPADTPPRFAGDFLAQTQRLLQGLHQDPGYMHTPQAMPQIFTEKHDSKRHTKQAQKSEAFDNAD